MGLLAPAFLLGFLAVAIPPLVHLLNRRRFETLDWAAMQFLQVSEQTRKKIFMEQFWLMLLRIVAIALLVFGVTSPWVKSPWLAKISPRPNRSIVIVIDGSHSMAYQDETGTAHDAAINWASQFIDLLQPGDSVAIVQAKQQPNWINERLTTDLKQIAGAVRNLPKPRGGMNFAATLREAIQLLSTAPVGQRDMIILTDGQRHGFADPKSLEKLELLSSGIIETDWPNVWFVNVVPERSANAPNWSLSPIQSTRAIASTNREVKFKCELQSFGTQGANQPPKVRFEVDGRPVSEQTPSTVTANGKIPLTFTTRFTTPGSHLISVMIDDDAMPGDNRQDYSLEVMPTIPVFIVDGDPTTGNRLAVQFLRNALAPPIDKTPSFLLKIVTPAEFQPLMLTRPMTLEASTVPRVLLLFNVPTLRPDQAKAVEDFANAGGGVLVTLGSRIEGMHYNQEFFREGRGWLPARLIEPVGDVNDVAKAPKVAVASLESPFLEPFKNEDPGSFVGATYFPRSWKLEATGPGSGSPVAVLSNRQPLFVEKSFGRGKVLVSAVPLDNSWRTNLTDLGDYVRLTHELVYYLAAARGADANLEARQPIMFRPTDGERPGPVTVQPPEGPSQRINVTEWPFQFDDTRETGVYQLTTDTGKVQYFVVQPDANESQLAQLNEDERLRLKRLIPTLESKLTPGEILAYSGESDTQIEFWWLLWLLVIIVLITEGWMTSRIAKA